ncbi:MAG: phosphopantothenoylcysteine decarboxylase [Phycisphaera sp.]|nr:phosphopantothenoylcysteine decarboxylase [Phycisphaera sp.]
MTAPAQQPEARTGRRLIVAVTGGIAAFKTCTLVSRLVQAGHDVTVLMTDAATRFVGPLTFESLSGKPVHTSQWQQITHHDSQHVALARGADLMVIAPASANTIARLAAGLCDNIVTTTAAALPRTTPVLLAPAMNAEMWDHPITQRNLATLVDTLGYHTVGPGEGWQACRTRGAGRMSEPDEILQRVEQLLGASSK